MHWCGLTREIGRHMPRIDIRCTGTVWLIKIMNWRNNSLNDYPIKFTITFVFIVIYLEVLNGLEEERKK